MDPRKEVIDSFDALIFSGDALVDPEIREAIRQRIKSWLREIDVMEKTFPEGDV